LHPAPLRKELGCLRRHALLPRVRDVVAALTVDRTQQPKVVVQALAPSAERSLAVGQPTRLPVVMRSCLGLGRSYLSLLAVIHVDAQVDLVSALRAVAAHLGEVLSVAVHLRRALASLRRNDLSMYRVVLGRCVFVDHVVALAALLPGGVGVVQLRASFFVAFLVFRLCFEVVLALGRRVL